LLLQAQAGGVVNGAELDDGDQILAPRIYTDLRGLRPNLSHHRGHRGHGGIA
jgi:hypothetical protein